MKTNENIFQKCCAAVLREARVARMFLRNWFRRRADEGAVKPDAVPDKPAPPRRSALDRITEHLHVLGLGRQVQVRFEAADKDFVLEDADGCVHAKDYDEAVIVIERIWLYQP